MALTFPEPLYQQAYKELKRLIVTGKLQPGEKVIMSKLAEQYEISRTPLREALRQLQSEGLIIQDHTTMKIVEINKHDFLDLYQTRIVLEKEVIKSIVGLIPEEDFPKIESILLESEKAIQEEDPYKILEANTQFHECLMNYCPNVRMIQLLNYVRSLLLIYRANINKKAKNNMDIYHEHRSIFEAVKTRDVEKSIQCIETHMLNDQKRGLEDL
ncbi:DNA-binding transcriptional regulator, GntR family [Mesobacillus persicus]|uniref:DNA-binding transcriptional regulator, GntR family n=1 Tax=Mesobacillus persicus TaxID=930146 RepID=A0A1H8F0G3_9BACI|nr:DNA-binding transcriptional regulator, GntR family [Mesobacillus persicus]